MQLFYNPHIKLDSHQIVFDKTESGHIVKVLRKKEGDILHITDGLGTLFTVEIVVANPNKCSANITRIEKKSKSRNYNLHIAIAPTKNNDRLEWFLEKATEIGVDEITPIICQNSERKVIKKERLEKIVQSAMKQSLQFHLPKLNDIMSFQDFIDSNPKGTLLIPYCGEEIEKNSLKESVKANEDATIVIGPEGDFSPHEIQQALEKKFTPVTLGENRLRTETAALASVQSVAFINQD